MAKKPLPRARIAVRQQDGTFDTKEPDSIFGADGELLRCPETGVDMANIGPAKQALRLWPSLKPSALPDTEAGRRYQLLLDEQQRRDEL